MLDLGWSELLIIGVVALIVVGPKDLPRMLRTLGQYAGRAKGIAREFQRSMDEAARQADLDELKDVKSTLDDLRADQDKFQREMSKSFMEGSSQTKKTANPMTSGATKGKPAETGRVPHEPKPEPSAEAAPEPAESKPAKEVVQDAPEKASGA